MSSLTQKIQTVINGLKGSDINGCITGSCLLERDFDTWDSHPDIDIFCYSPESMVHAADVITMQLGFIPGKEAKGSEDGEAWKLKRVRTKGVQKNNSLSTLSFIKDDVVINVTCKKHQNHMVDVLTHFDMSIIMKGFDIPSQTELDLRTIKEGDINIAIPNPLRNQDPDLWNVDHWIRQFDRVIKYWDRGFDTRPMAQFYLDLIDETIAIGCMFTSAKAKDAYENFSSEFIEQRAKIEKWLQDKED